jgi:hypothetical protein
MYPAAPAINSALTTLLVVAMAAMVLAWVTLRRGDGSATVWLAAGGQLAGERTVAVDGKFRSGFCDQQASHRGRDPPNRLRPYMLHVSFYCPSQVSQRGRHISYLLPPHHPVFPRHDLLPGASVGWRPWQSSGDHGGGGGGGGTRAAFVVLVAPGYRTTTALWRLLKSLDAHVLAAHPRPVLLFYGDDVAPEDYTPKVLDKACPPAIRHLIEAREPVMRPALRFAQHAPAPAVACVLVTRA